MPFFTYTARKQDGSETKGQIDAVSIQVARSTLQEMKLEVEELHEATQSELDTLITTTPVETPLPPPPLPFSVEQQMADKNIPTQKSYYSLVDTFRIYAGWLLALLSLAYIVGAYQYTKEVPLNMPILQALVFSPLLLQVALISFLFLLLSGIQRITKGGVAMGIILTVVGLAAFVFYRANIL